MTLEEHKHDWVLNTRDQCGLICRKCNKTPDEVGKETRIASILAKGE